MCILPPALPCAGGLDSRSWSFFPIPLSLSVPLRYLSSPRRAYLYSTRMTRPTHIASNAVFYSFFCTACLHGFQKDTYLSAAWETNQRSPVQRSFSHLVALSKASPLRPSASTISITDKNKKTANRKMMKLVLPGTLK